MLFLPCKKNDIVVVCADGDNKGKSGKVINITKRKTHNNYVVTELELKFEDDSTKSYYDWQVCEPSEYKPSNELLTKDKCHN